MTKYIVGILLFMWTFGGGVIVTWAKITRHPDIVGDIELALFQAHARAQVTDGRALLHDIEQQFDTVFQSWVKRDRGNSQHALDMAEHRSRLDELMSVLCENYDALGPPQTDPSKDEIDHPGR